MTGTRRRDAAYDAYVLENETVKFAIHRHWAILVPPALAVLGTLALAFAAFAVLGRAGELVARAVLLWCLGQLLYLGWQIVEWRSEYFLATDKRLLLVQGLLAKKVGTMPMVKVTDLSYHRSIAGRALGYGTFVFESAGQDQALRRIDWIPAPDHYYRLVDAVMHGVTPDPRDLPYLLDDGPRTPSPSASMPPADDPARPVHGPAEVIYESEDIRARRRSDDTRAIPITRHGPS